MARDHPDPGHFHVWKTSNHLPSPENWKPIMSKSTAKAGRPFDAPMAVEQWPIDQVLPYGRNPRIISEAAVAMVAASIQDFGWRQPIVVDGKGVIIVGHTRHAAARKLGLEGVPVMVANDLTAAQAKAYRIADNRTGQETTWADDLLAMELGDLKDLDVDLSTTGFTELDIENLFSDPVEDSDDISDDTYTRRIEAPIYEPTGDKPPVSALFDDTKTRELMGAINAAGLPDDIAAFLEAAAQRHTVFNFARIADFYAHSSPEIQQLMEASALVIIDFDQAIERGFVRLSKRLGELTGETP